MSLKRRYSGICRMIRISKILNKFESKSKQATGHNLSDHTPKLLPVYYLHYSDIFYSG